MLLGWAALASPTASAQGIPDNREWSVPVAAAPSAPPVISGSVVVIALRGGALLGHALADGAAMWKTELAVERGMSGDDERVFVAEKDAVVAIDAKTGRQAWRVTVGGAITAPPLAHAGWVIVCSGGELLALRAADGSVVWRKGVGPVEFRPAIEGDLLVVSVVEGRVAALDVTSGEERWTRAVAGEPTAPSVSGDRVYVGTTAKSFVAIYSASGRIESTTRVGAVPRGAAAVDERNVYFTGLDNVLNAADRGNGAKRWHKGLPFRPIDGPVVVGGAIVVPGYVPSLPAHLPRDGTAFAEIAFPGRLAAEPLFAKRPNGAAIAIGITGGEDNKLSLTLMGVSPIAALPVQPLSELPGALMPLPLAPGG